MAAKTSIEWTRGSDGSPGASWNPIRARNRETGKTGWFCSHLTPGCDRCYAESINHRLGTGIDFKRQNRDKVEIFLDEKILTQPVRWRGPRKIFVCSMTDLFAEFVPNSWLDRIFAVMALCPHHVFQVLTKRSERMRNYVSTMLRHPDRVALHADRMQRGGPHTPHWLSNAYQWPKSPPHEALWPLENCWLGVSVEDQPLWDERWPALAATPAAVRWISYEPALGPVDFNAMPGDALDWLGRLHWVVVGGESGPGARPFDLAWARSIIAQCKAAKVSCFVKQVGANPREGTEFPLDDYRNRPMENALHPGHLMPLRDRKGGDPEEWSPDLRVREFPR